MFILGYYDKIVGAFKNIRQKLPVHGKYNTTLYVDGANGVGGKKLNIIKKTLDGELDLVLNNLGGNGGKLNLNVSSLHNIYFFIYISKLFVNISSHEAHRGTSLYIIRGNTLLFMFIIILLGCCSKAQL